MNIDDIVFQDATELHLRHPVSDEPLYTSSGSPMAIRLASRDSAAYKRLMTQWQNDILRRGGKKLTAEMVTANTLDQLAVLTLGWNLEGKDGPIPCTADNARRLYQDKDWIKEQVEACVSDLGRYLGEAATP